MNPAPPQSRSSLRFWLGWGSPEDVARIWGRVLILFAGLALIKCAMIVGQDQHLFQTHWRLRARERHWFDILNYYLFFVLAVGTTVLLGKECRRLPRRSLRFANAWVLFFGLLAVFLSFREGERNYLYPVMEGVLGFGDLWAYISMNLFYRPPFLAAWILGYAFLYYILLRKGLEHWTLSLMGIVGAIYALTQMPFLYPRGNELLVANCFALGGLAGWSRRRHGAQLAWLLVPAALVLAVCLLVRAQSPILVDLNPYLLIVWGEALVLFGAATWCARRLGYFRTWDYFLPFYFIAFILLSNVNYPSASNYNNLVWLALSTPHYFFGEAVVALLFLAALRLAVLRWPRRGPFAFDALAVLILLLAFIDYKILETMDVRLDWNVITLSNSVKMIWRMAQPYLAAATGLLLGGTLLYLGLTWLICYRHGHHMARTAHTWERRPHHLAASLALLALAGLFRVPEDKFQGGTIGNILASSPLIRNLSIERYPPEEFRRLAGELQIFPQHSHEVLHPDHPRARPVNVFLIVMESSYNKHLSLFGAQDETQPLLSAYADRMELFPNFYLNFPTSNHARISILTSLYGNKKYVSYSRPHIRVRSLTEILSEQGYTTAVFDSSFLDYARFRDFLAPRNIDLLYDYDNMPGRGNYRQVSWGLLEECVMNAVNQQFREFARTGKPFFLSYQPVAPHYPFDSPSQRFAQFESLGAIMGGNLTGRYKNQLLYLDWIMAKMLDTLEETGLLENTLVVITNDHGEMLGEEKGKIGHGWNLEPELTNTPLIIMDPRRPGHRINETLGSHVDVLPTILDLIDVPLPAGELYQGASLYDDDANRNKIVYLNSFQQRGIVRDRRFIREFPARDGSATHPTEVYQIEFHGPKTLFHKLDESPDITPQLDRFEAFQESLIHNYSHYRDSFGVEPEQLVENK